MTSSCWLSMTGYGAAEQANGSLILRVEVRSVNQKNREVRVFSSPRNLAWEHELQQLAQKAIARGKLDVQLTVQALAVGGSLADSALQRLRGRLWRAQLVLGQSQAAEYLTGRLLGESKDDSEAELAVVLNVGALALQRLRQSRQAEGAGLHAIVQAQHAELHSSLSKIALFKNAEAELRRQQLHEKFAALRAGGLAEADRHRFEEEITYQLMRSDISEEIERLRLHLAALAKLLQQSSPLGKQLDVLAQELGREAHTLASKSSYPPLKDEALRLRAMVDQLREQAQNIE